ncbi:hypothetical protein PUNSTDRAFT_89660 [Punctularia strigosozonata HHB-11173 SS5]|uniref:uncharacterized protein n=1 Tax=Punctularia strigosozonata (strain HHB-11173) TaxID=741275 RepID=UPI000441873B|nr:uncharacterized protein PUNSTDRAFT_89660 [Punctularia strigosozonata HHB-11173 SS5]EIN07389.1 hypothetical protein PUNSTDRAFT_89660 [Punctularia strigosozonata HHB-11173 SS5]
MPGFFTGDELGNIKHVRYAASFKTGDPSAVPVTLYDGPSAGSSAIQALAVEKTSDDVKLIATAHQDGSTFVSALEGDMLTARSQWKETRIRKTSRFVGLTIANNAVFSCTSNGALRRTALGSADNSQDIGAATASLPMRLCDWKLDTTGQAFAYGGDEVELSLWNTERAFSQPTSSTVTPPPESEKPAKKRRRGDELFPGEVWRAKNVPNDSLNLRVPVHNTSFDFISSSGSSAQIVCGTANGNMRRYDTRAARRPVADWKGIAKVGGIRFLCNGVEEHEAFAADQGNLFSVDLRNGRVNYAYKGIAGAVVCAAPCPGFLGSVAQDRLFRLHTTKPLPKTAGHRQEEKGEVLDKVYMKSSPTAIVWDGVVDAELEDDGSEGARRDEDDVDGDDEDVWDKMRNVDDSDSEAARGKKARKT